MRLEGKTAAGRRVSIEGMPGSGYRGKAREADTAAVWIDGEEASVERVDLLRDGGTRTIVTDRGTIRMYRYLGADEHFDALDGERLEPLER